MRTSEALIDRLVEWLRASRLFPDKNLHVDLIVNPQAGALLHSRRARKLLAILEGAHRRRGEHSPRRPVRVAVWTTEFPGHEKQILSHLATSDPLGPGDLRLVVTAGGDGTSRGTLISALSLDPSLLERTLFFRLPLGTGNDAADSPDWSAALEVLGGGNDQVGVRPLPLIEVRTPGQPVHFSFNIASLGLDAFVSDLTNRLKAWFPGNSYSLMVDLATLFYESFVRVVPATLELTKGRQVSLRWTDAFLLAALGTTGRKTYGAGKKILPDHDNFCLAGRQNLFEKLGLRTPFYQGTHRGRPGIHLASGDTLTVSSPVRLPLQMDGEVLWLEPSDFPLTMTIVDRGVKVLSLAGSGNLA